MAQWWERSPPGTYQCGPDSNPGVDAICGLSLLLILSFALRGFSLITPVFPSPQKPTFPNSNSTRTQARWRTILWMCYFQIITSFFLFLFIYFFIFSLKFDRHSSKLVKINRQSSKIPPHRDTLFHEVLKGRFGGGVPPRRAFKPWPRLKTKIVHFATLFKKRDPILRP